MINKHSNQFELGLFRESELKNSRLNAMSYTIAELKEIAGRNYDELMLLCKSANFQAVFLFINTRLKHKPDEERTKLAHELNYIFNLK